MSERQLVGGLSSSLKSPDSTLTQVLEAIEADLRTQLLEQVKLGGSGSTTAAAASEPQAEFDETALIIEPISYKTQVVAGLNYFVKLRIRHKDRADFSKIIHARIYRSFNQSTELASLTEWKEETDELAYF